MLSSQVLSFRHGAGAMVAGQGEGGGGEGGDADRKTLLVCHS